MRFKLAVPLLFCCLVNMALAQDVQEERLRTVKSDQSNKCLANLYLVQFMTDFVGQENQRLFVISRRAKSEKQDIEWKRLSSVKRVLNLQKFPPELVTLAAGLPSDEKAGFLEFWIGSKLLGKSYMQKNEQVCFSDL